MSESEAIEALRDAKLRLERSGDKRDIADAIRDARLVMTEGRERPSSVYPSRAVCCGTWEQYMLRDSC